MPLDFLLNCRLGQRLVNSHSIIVLQKKIRRGLLDSVENVYGYLVRADDSGDTPLHLACRDPSAYCFKVLSIKQ